MEMYDYWKLENMKEFAARLCGFKTKLDKSAAVRFGLVAENLYFSVYADWPEIMQTMQWKYASEQFINFVYKLFAEEENFCSIGREFLDVLRHIDELNGFIESYRPDDEYLASRDLVIDEDKLYEGAVM